MTIEDKLIASQAKDIFEKDARILNLKAHLETLN